MTTTSVRPRGAARTAKVPSTSHAQLATATSQRAAPNSRAKTNIAIDRKPAIELALDASKATESFNTALKKLSSALKTKLDNERKHVAPRSPLQTRSPNRVSKSTTKDSGKSPTAVKAPITETEEIRVAGQKAITSLAALYQIKERSRDDEVAQLDQGAAILTNKLLGLGLCDLALKKLCNTGIRLHHRKQLKCGSLKESAQRSPTETIELLCSFLASAGLPDTTAAAINIMTYHTQILKALSQSSCSIPDTILRAVNPSVAGSACHFIFSCLGKGLITDDQASQFLHTISQLLLSLAESCSSAKSTIPSDMLRFQLRCMALEIRCQWWQAAKHQFDMEREYWRPFVRYLAKLQGSQTTLSGPIMSAISTAFESLQSRTKELDNGDATTPPLYVLTKLGDLADASGDIRLASALYGRARGCRGSEPDLSSAVVACKAATLSLSTKPVRNIEKASEAVQAVVGILQGPLKGGTADFDALLAEVIKFRRVVVQYTQCPKEQKCTENVKAGDCLHLACSNAVIGCVSFFLRYLTTFEGREKVQNDRDGARVRQALKPLLSVLDSALTVLKARATLESQVDWDACERTMSEIQQVTAVACNHCTEEQRASLELVFVKLSNLLYSRSQVADSTDKPTLLRKAINIIQQRPATEWRNGALSAKYEKLAMALYQSGSVVEAANAYRSAINACMDHELTAAMMVMAKNGAAETIWTFPEERVGYLDRLIGTYVKLAVKGGKVAGLSSGLVGKFDDESIRMLLLERHLHHLLKHPTSSNSADLVMDSTRVLLTFYQRHEYPLRRLRTLFRVLSQSSREPGSFPDDFIDSLAHEDEHAMTFEHGLSSDEGLEPYRAFLITSFQLVAAFRLRRPSPELIDSAVSTWDSLVAATSSTTDLMGKFEQIDSFLSLISTTVDYTGALGMDETKLEALKFENRLSQLLPPQYEISSLQLAAHLIHVRQLGLAASHLERMRDQFSATSSPTLAKLHYRLLWADLFLDSGKPSECLQSLNVAHLEYDALLEDGTSVSRTETERVIALAAIILSRLNLENGQIESAVLYAKQSVKITNRHWAITEQKKAIRQKEVPDSTHESIQDSSLESLVDTFAALSTEGPSGSNNPESSGPQFWQQVDLHERCLLNMSFVATHIGLFQDALFFAEQAKKVAVGVGADQRLHRINGVIGDIHVSAGQLELGMDLLQSVPCHVSNQQSALNAVRIAMSLAKASNLCDSPDVTLEHLNNAGNALDKACEYAEPTPKLLLPRSVEEETAKSTTVRQKRVVKGNAGNTSGTRPSRKTKDQAVQSTKVIRGKGAQDHETNRILDKQLATISTLLLLQRANVVSAAGQIDEAFNILELSKHAGFEGLGSLTLATVLFRQARNELTCDTVYSILFDSTISWPSRNASETPTKPKNDVQKMKSQQAKGGRAGRGRASPTTARTSDTVTTTSRPVQPLFKILQTFEGHKRSVLTAPLPVLQRFVDLTTKTSLLLSTSDDILSPFTSQLAHRSYVCGITAAQRETFAIKADRRLRSREVLTHWPRSGEAKNGESCYEIEAENLAQQVAGSLPERWTAISIQITDDKKDLLVTRSQQGTEPLTLKLPIERLNEDEEEDEVFGYSDCRAELMEIISEANTSAHVGGDASDKQVKKEWWSQRQMLDARLGCLLDNIEKFWLGGFRGIFSVERHEDSPFAVFSQSLHQILDNHLPSRKRIGPTNQQKIHDNVLDLFIGLGNPDIAELDDAVADLLAFVVDILQFAGERNAYDEIDFDMMAVETMDALRTYHHSTERPSQNSSADHIVLVLSKELLCLPWESLPCLRNKSVSRMPSLLHLQQRLDQMRKQSSSSAAGLLANVASGSYILNPSLDLSGTEATFSSTLANSLPTYTAIVSRSPSESEFTSCLSSSSICLYFGHGSGAQYIRGRTIRELDSCATTFLMGCSSALMHEVGEYEPYGVPGNYMSAGAPAVVGTLWDVTDKDIDRFAMRSLVNWGLLEPTCLEEVDSGKGKGKKRKVQQAPPIAGGQVVGGAAARGKVGLGQAIADARDVCILRYLNGAAPVIYGIPAVFLE